MLTMKTVSQSGLQVGVQTLLSEQYASVYRLALYGGDDEAPAIRCGLLWIEHDPTDSDFPLCARFAGEDDAEFIHNDVEFPVEKDLLPTVEELVQQVAGGMITAEIDWRRAAKANEDAEGE